MSSSVRRDEPDAQVELLHLAVDTYVKTHRRLADETNLWTGAGPTGGAWGDGRDLLASLAAFDDTDGFGTHMRAYVTAVGGWVKQLRERMGPFRKHVQSLKAAADQRAKVTKFLADWPGLRGAAGRASSSTASPLGLYSSGSGSVAEMHKAFAALKRAVADLKPAVEAAAEEGAQNPHAAKWADWKAAADAAATSALGTKDASTLYAAYMAVIDKLGDELALEAGVTAVGEALAERLQRGVPVAAGQTPEDALRSVSNPLALGLVEYEAWHPSLPEAVRVPPDVLSEGAVRLRPYYLYAAGAQPRTAFVALLQGAHKKLTPALQRYAANKRASGVADQLKRLLALLVPALTTLNGPVGGDKGALAAVLAQLGAVQGAAASTKSAMDALRLASGQDPVSVLAAAATAAAAASGGAKQLSSAVGSSSSSVGLPPALAAAAPYSTGKQAMSVAPPFLYRVLDEDAARAYTKQLEAFVKQLDGAKFDEDLRVMVHDRARKTFAAIATALQNVEAQRGGVEAARLAYERKQILKQKAVAMAAFLKGTRAMLERVRAIHYAFATRVHRDGLRYMWYWKSVTRAPELPPPVRAYFETLERRVELEHVTTTFGRLQAATDEVLGELAWADGLDDDVVEATSRELAALSEQRAELTERVAAYYRNASGTVAEAVLDGGVLTLYALKAVRVLLMWAALKLADRVFQASYAQAVYGENADPPHPARFVGLYLAADLALTATLWVFLALLKSMFATDLGSFPITAAVLRAFTVDYVLSQALIAAVALAIAVVVYRKKYFRYKYEGERGVRALRTMVSNIAAVVIIGVPFFRLA